MVAMFVNMFPYGAFASSHREAPLIANDPLADNTDLYAFRSPDIQTRSPSLPVIYPGNCRKQVPTITSLEKISVMKFMWIMILPQRVMTLLIASPSVKRMKTPPLFLISGWESKI